MFDPVLECPKCGHKILVSTTLGNLSAFYGLARGDTGMCMCEKCRHIFNYLVHASLEILPSRDDAPQDNKISILPDQTAAP